MQTDRFLPSSTFDQALDRAALLWGIQPQYGDTWGKVHVTAPETKKRILSALGVPAHSKESLDAAVETRLKAEWCGVVPPVVVIGQAAYDTGFPVFLPEADLDAGITLEIRWEDGGVDRRTVRAADLPESGRMQFGKETCVRKQVSLPHSAPLGYHEAEVTISGRRKRSGRTRLILCPDRCYEPPSVKNGSRAAGIAVALYGLRSARNQGCGDFTDLETLADWTAEDAHASFIGLNPLHAIPNRQPFNISPYLPSSAFYKNPIYLDLERIEWFHRCPHAKAWYSRREVQDEFRRLRDAELVQYERVWALKLRGLKHAFGRFLHENGRRHEDFEKFVRDEGDLLERYAVWSALDDWLHRQNPDLWIWPQWPEEYRDPESASVREFAVRRWRLVLFYKWLQWQADLQLEAAHEYGRRKGLSIGLYHDLALATDRCGSDLWAWRPFYVSGCRVGAPPDGFSPKGQDWGFPPPNSEHHRETGYRMFAQLIRQNCRHGGALRMDHVMRFFRLYWIPEGLEPADGAYVSDHHEELLHVLALESVRNKTIMVGEDLGTVTKSMRAALDRFGVFGYRIPYFEKSEAGILRMPPEYSEHALVSSSTHDLPTLAGFWIGRDIEARREAGLLPDDAAYRRMLEERAKEKQQFLTALFSLGLLPDWFPQRAEQVPELVGELHNAFVGWIAQARSRLLALNQEDLVKDAEQQNLPATNADQYPNWMHRMHFTVEEMRTNPYVRDVTAMFRHWIEETGRANRPDAAGHA